MAEAEWRGKILALQKRAFDLSCAIIDAYPRKPYPDEPSRIVWRQLLKATTSSTFNLEEADAASSAADFLAKMRIALREAKETNVAIRIICRCKLDGHEAVKQYEDESLQLARIFGRIIVNKKANMRLTRPSR